MAAVNDKNLGCVLYGKNDLRLEEQPVSLPGPDEVLIRMQRGGICGSDIHYLNEGGFGDLVLEAPFVLGHESAGVVKKVGKGVHHLKPGDRVGLEPVMPCRYCDWCKVGRSNICANWQCVGAPPLNGTLSRFRLHKTDLCHKLPDTVSYEEGALLEPLSCAVHACRRGKISLGHNVLVCGAGTIGLVNMLAARAMGASKIVITDISEHRLKTATELGADATLMVANKKPEEVAAQVAQLLGGQGPHVTMECSGAESSIQTAIYATRSGGVVVLVGLSSAKLTQIPLVNAATRELDIRGSFTFVNCYQTALEMVASGKVNVKPIITHRYKLEQAVEAFETARKGRAIKVMIDCEK